MLSKNKLLYISWIIPPSTGGSAYITHQLAKHFDSNELVIVGGSRIPFQGMKMYDGVKYNYFFTEISLRGHGNRYFFIFRWLMFPFFLWNLIHLTKKENPNAILATFPDGYYLLAALLLTRICKLKLFTYFHNTYTENRHGLSKWLARKIQKQVFHDSKIIYTMSEGMLEYYAQHYPEISSKFEVLPHTFDRYPKHNHAEQLQQNITPYKLVMIGTFNHSNMEATLRLLQLVSKNPIYQVDIYTATDINVLKFKWGLDTGRLGVRHCGIVKQEEVNQILSHYDVCLLTHGFTGEYTAVEYQTIFPTRMIPMLLSGIPILAHSPEHSFLNKFIRKYDCAELVSEKSDVALLHALEIVTQDQFRIKQLIEHAKKASAYFYGPDIANMLMKQINN